MSTPSIPGLKSTGYRAINTPTKTNQQMDFYNQFSEGSRGGINSALQGLSGIASGDQSYFNQLEAPALRQFGELQGNIASRFSGMGSGARKSSGFQNATSGAAADLSERLQGQRLGLQQQAWQQLLGMGTHLFDQNLFETSLIPKKKKWWETLGGGLADLGSTAGGFALGRRL